MQIFYIIIGAVCGVLSRFYLSNLANNYPLFGIKVGTIAVNLLGSFIMGIIWGLIENRPFDPRLKLMLTTGFLGCFTTFSTFSLETLQYFNSGDIGKAVLNVAVSNIFGIALAFIGYFIVKSIIKQ